MKNLIVIYFVIITLISSCTGVENNPGTLGASALHQLNCSEDYVDSELDRLLTTEEFKISIQDTNIVGWWKRNQYDFLNYRCMNIWKNLYMVTISSENSVETDISIRSFYDRRQKEWIFAAEFNSKSTYKAEVAMKYLLEQIGECE